MVRKSNNFLGAATQHYIVERHLLSAFRSFIHVAGCSSFKEAHDSDAWTKVWQLNKSPLWFTTKQEEGVPDVRQSCRPLKKQFFRPFNTQNKPHKNQGDATQICKPYQNHAFQTPWQLLQEHPAICDGLADMLIIVIASTLPLEVNDGSCGKGIARLVTKSHNNIGLHITAANRGPCVDIMKYKRRVDWGCGQQVSKEGLQPFLLTLISF